MTVCGSAGGRQSSLRLVAWKATRVSCLAANSVAVLVPLLDVDQEEPETKQEAPKLLFSFWPTPPTRYCSIFAEFFPPLPSPISPISHPLLKPPIPSLSPTIRSSPIDRTLGYFCYRNSARKSRYAHIPRMPAMFLRRYEFDREHFDCKPFVAVEHLSKLQKVCPFNLLSAVHGRHQAKQVAHPPPTCFGQLVSRSLSVIHSLGSSLLMDILSTETGLHRSVPLYNFPLLRIST